MAESCQKWYLKIKMVTGLLSQQLDVHNPESITVLQLKELVHKQFPSLNAEVYLQKLLVNSRTGPETTILEDSRYLASYPTLGNGATVMLIIKLPYKLYIQDTRHRMHTITIPSSAPESYTIRELSTLVERCIGAKMSEHQFQFNEHLLEECRHGKQLTLHDCGIKSEDSLIITKMGLAITISEAQADICFTMDCTGSMGGHIEAVKANIKLIRDQLAKKFRGCDIRFAFMKYTDYDQPSSTRITYLNFTSGLQEFHKFVDPIVADGGADTPEDIMGALKVTFSQLSWRPSCSKVLIHIADAPCHGTQYHNTSDNYPNGDPAGITHDQMMREVNRLDIQYWFGYINKDLTDRMITIFNSSLQSVSNQRLIIRQFDIKDPQSLGEAVFKAATASMFSAAAHKTCLLDNSIPNWSVLPVKKGIKTPPAGFLSLHSLQEGLVLEDLSVEIAFKVAPYPFQDGAECLVYRGLDTGTNKHIVLKRFKGGSSSKNVYMKALEVQLIAETYAREFNSHKKLPPRLSPLEFIVVDIVKVNDGSYHILQPFVEGKFEKFNTNNGVVCANLPQSDTMQAFSHFTWAHSGQSLLICDLQGIETGRGVQLIDPAIHCRAIPKKYGDTDLGYLGIRRFFNTHECGAVCRAMELQTIRP